LAATLNGDAATAQAGRIRPQLDRLPVIPRALLVVAYALRDVACNGRAPCCSGRYPDPELREALDRVVAHTAPSRDTRSMCGWVRHWSLTC